MNEFVEHTFKPIYNDKSKVLILGTMPSPKSRENGFYYSHPQNRFWRVISELYNKKLPRTNNEKIKLLLDCHIALWDVLKSCNINGADDSSIKNPVVNDINGLLEHTNICIVFTTGAKASSLYKKYCSESIKIPSIALPSTSPANCRFYNFDSLKESYKIIKYYTD